MSNLCSLKRAPRYRLHKCTGQAVVTINGKDLYLGKPGSAASHEFYRRAIASWAQSGGRSLPAQDGTTITEVIVAYTEFAQGYYRKDGKPTDEVRMIKTAIKIARELYGRTAAAEFGPLALKTCREQMIGKDWCRSHINKQVGRIKRMFKWATENEMIPGGIYDALRWVA